MKQPAPSFLVRHLRKINRLRWFFIGVFVLIVWLISRELSQVLSLLVPTALLIVSMLVFDWHYRRLERKEDVKARQLEIENFIFWQVLLDIAFITFGISLTGGRFSLLPLIYVVYFGALEIFFGPVSLLLLSGVALFSYIGVVQIQRLGWLPENLPGLPVYAQFSAQMQNNELYYFILIVLFLNVILVVLRSSQVRRQWLSTEAENNFLTHLNRLSRTAIADVDDVKAFVRLCDETKAMLGADSVYITRWDEENEQVFSLAADQSVHEFYMKNPAPSRFENTFTRSSRQAGKPLIAENVRCSPYVSLRVATQFSAISVLAVPLNTGGENRFLGALLVSYRRPHLFSSHEVARIQQISDILGLLISRTWLYEEAMRRAELLEKMAGQVTSLVSDLKRTTLLPSIVESARSLLQAQRAALHLQQDGGEMKCEYSVGLSENFLEQLTVRFNQLAGGKLLHHREYIVIPDVSQDSRTSPVQDLIFGEKFRSYAVFSLNQEYEQKGALSLYWDAPHVVSADEISVGKLFAERASAIIRSAHIYARATEEALTDILTELPNRRHLDQRIQDEIERASRYEHTFALLMIDLDGFKGINDTFGHPIGDSVLKQVATALRRTLRASDFLARYGGDEFSIILPETGLERAMMVAEKLRLSLTSTRLHLPQETQRYLSGCVGIAVYPYDRQTAEEMLICADKRMYRAKRSGSGSIIYQDD